MRLSRTGHARWAAKQERGLHAGVADGALRLLPGLAIRAGKVADRWRQRSPTHLAHQHPPGSTAQGCARPGDTNAWWSRSAARGRCHPVAAPSSVHSAGTYLSVRRGGDRSALSGCVCGGYRPCRVTWLTRHHPGYARPGRPGKLAGVTGAARAPSRTGACCCGRLARGQTVRSSACAGAWPRAVRPPGAGLSTS